MSLVAHLSSQLYTVRAVAASRQQVQKPRALLTNVHNQHGLARCCTTKANLYILYAVTDYPLPSSFASELCVAQLVPPHIVLIMGFSVQVYGSLVCPKDREQMHKALLSRALLVLPINSGSILCHCQGKQSCQPSSCLSIPLGSLTAAVLV